MAYYIRHALRVESRVEYAIYSMHSHALHPSNDLGVIYHCIEKKTCRKTFLMEYSINALGFQVFRLI